MDTQLNFLSKLLDQQIANGGSACSIRVIADFFLAALANAEIF